MHIAILANPTSWYAGDLQRAAVARGHWFTRVEFPHLSDRISGPTESGCEQSASHIRAGEAELSDLDALIVRTMPPGSLEQVVFRMDVLARLEHSGVTVINGPKAIECAVDKYLTTAKLAADGLPVPETFVCETSAAALQAFEQLGGDVVVKPIFGAEGRGIVRVSDPDLAFRTFRTLERIGSLLYVQRYVEHGGSDIRVLLFDGDVLGAIRRWNSSDFRVNVSRRGSAERHQPSDEEIDLARRSATATSARFCGVDLLYDSRGRCYVIEVNAIPGWQAFSRATGFDVADELVRRLETART